MLFEGKVRNLQNRKFCLTCSPFGSHNTRPDMARHSDRRVCKCGEDNQENFSIRGSLTCNKCHTKYTTAKQIETRERARAYLGGKCVYCGFTKYRVALDIHHIDRSKKDPQFRRMRSWGWERIVKELKHCELVCKNCHIAIHCGLLECTRGRAD